MNKSVFLYILTILILSSCVSKKDFTALEERHKKTVDLLNTATVKLNTCLEEKATSEALAEAYLNQISDLKNLTKFIKCSIYRRNHVKAFY